jgi:hypothetical protein
MTDSLQKIQDQINRVGGVMSPDFLKRAAAQGMYKEDPAQTIAALFTNLKFAARQGGTSMKTLMEGGGTASQQVLVQQLSEMLGVKAGGYANAFQMMRAEAENRVMDVQKATTDTDRKRLGKQIFSEFYKGAKTKGGIEQFLNSKGMGKYVKDSYEATLDNMLSTKEGMKDFIDLSNENLDAIADSGETQDKILKANAEGNKQGADALAEQISQARGIATRTQSVGDLLSNTFKPLLIKLVGTLEGIASVVSKWFGHDVKGAGSEDAKKFTEAQEEQFGKVQGAIDTLGDTLDAQQKKLRDFQDAKMDKQTGKMSKTDADTANAMAQQIGIGSDTLKKLEEIQEKGAFTSGSQESLVMDAIGKIASGGMPGLEGGGFAKAVTINNYYSSQVQQDTTPSVGGNKSPEESAQTPKPQAVGK